MSLDMRLQAIETAGFITREERLVLAPTGGGPLPRLENLCTLLPLGLSLAPNFRINGRDRVVPMVTEEASVVAGASRIAVLLRSGEGLRATAGERLLGGQVLWAWQGSWQDLAALTEPRQGELLERLNGLHPSLVGAGGGLRSFCWRAGPEAGLQVLDLVAHTGDAMGAHLLDRLAAELAGELLRFLPGRPVTSIVRIAPWVGRPGPRPGCPWNFWAAVGGRGPRLERTSRHFAAGPSGTPAGGPPTSRGR
jgi:hydroxymethylglutaryl-CoA reductase